MRELPFEDQTIDVVVSSLAIHNIPNKEGRSKAVQEIARVLKPQGQVVLVDFQHTDEYAQTLRTLGWHDVTLSRLQFQMFPPVRVLTGKKPLGGEGGLRLDRAKHPFNGQQHMELVLGKSRGRMALQQTSFSTVSLGSFRSFLLNTETQSSRCPKP